MSKLFVCINLMVEDVGNIIYIFNRRSIVFKNKKWQQLWDENPHNKLFQIQPILKERKLEETTLT